MINTVTQLRPATTLDCSTCRSIWNSRLRPRLDTPSIGLGRYAPEGGLIMLILSLVAHDPGCVKTPCFM
jgi:hypothetical protein